MKETQLIKVEKVDQKLLDEIVRRILRAVNPLKIILFGSWAYGTPRKGSDLDILVVVDNLTISRRKMRIKIRGLLRDFLIPKDVVVVTHEDIEEWGNVPQAFITTIERKGRIIYERKN